MNELATLERAYTECPSDENRVALQRARKRRGFDEAQA